MLHTVRVAIQEETFMSVTSFARAATLVLAAVSTSALAQNYPTKPIRLITPFTAGAGADIITRKAAEELMPRLGQPMVHEARPGGNFLISGDACARAPADGYTLCVVTPGTVTYAPFVNAKMPYDPERDLKPVANLFWVIGGLYASPSLGINTLDELKALAAKGRKFNWATFGIGNNTDAVRQWVQDGLKMQATAIPYNSPPAIITAVMTGEADLTWIGVYNALGQTKAGKVKLIGVDSMKRWGVYPNVPTLDEALGPFNMRVWIGVMAPGAMPDALVRRVSGEYVKLFNEPKFIQWLDEAGVQNGIMGPAEFAKLLRTERDDAAVIVKKYNFQVQ
jgi:tripartite-type tricarboxylate transporter receptor subunit TctC